LFFINEAEFGGDDITNVHSYDQWTEENLEKFTIDTNIIQGLKYGLVLCVLVW
jgi:hypothetical protein